MISQQYTCVNCGSGFNFSDHGWGVSKLGNAGNDFCSDRCYHEWKKNNPSQGCFIATSVYGNYDHPIVLDLREFRDNWLSKREKGKKFIRWYYQKGPMLATWIDKSKTRKLFALSLIVKPLHFFVKLFRLYKK